MRLLYKLRSNTTYTESLDTLDDREDQNYEQKRRSNQTNRNTLRKTETKIFERTERDRRKPPGTTTPMVIKQYILLL